MPVHYCLLNLALAVAAMTPETHASYDCHYTPKPHVSCDFHGACSQHSPLFDAAVDDHIDGLQLHVSLLQVQASLVHQPRLPAPPLPSLQHHHYAMPSSGSQASLDHAGSLSAAISNELLVEHARNWSNSTHDISHELALVSGIGGNDPTAPWRAWLSYQVWASICAALLYIFLMCWSAWLQSNSQTSLAPPRYDYTPRSAQMLYNQCKWAIVLHLMVLNVVSFNIVYLLPGVELAAEARLHITVMDYNVLLGVSLMFGAPMALVSVTAARYVGWMKLNQIIFLAMVVVAAFQLMAIMYGSFGMLMVSYALIQCISVWSMVFSQTLCAWVFFGESYISTAFSLVCLGVDLGIVSAMTFAPVMLVRGSIELVFIQGVAMAVVGFVSSSVISQLMSVLPREISDKVEPQKMQKLESSADKTTLDSTSRFETLGDPPSESEDSRSMWRECQEILIFVPVPLALVCLGCAHIYCQRLNLGGMLMVADHVNIALADSIANVPVLMLLLTAVPVGIIADKIGQRPFMLMLGCTGMGICSLLLMSRAAAARRTGMFGYGVAWALFQSSLWVMFPKMLPAHLVDLANGIAIFTGVAGGAIGCIVVGISMESCGFGVYGMHCGEYVIASIAAVAALIAACFWARDIVDGSRLAHP